MMIVLFTDFGADDLYVGQVHAVLAQHAPNIPRVDLLHCAPVFDIRHSAYLLSAYIQKFPVNSVVLAVVDPGVGGDRKAVVLQTEKRWYVGPDNGLLTIVARQEGIRDMGEIEIADDVLPGFHGRDIFAPVAASLARGSRPRLLPHAMLTESNSDWPDDLYEVIYIDHYGNVITGIHADALAEKSQLQLKGRKVKYARVFSEVETGDLFWYRNSNNMVEIAANQDSAAQLLDIEIGEKITRN